MHPADYAPRMKVAYLSVHYVASGPGHLDRLPCWIRLLHEDGVQSKQAIVDWGRLMVSPLTELTHLTTEMIQTNGTSFERAIAALRSELSSDTIIVGMNTKRHVRALQLCKNVHYSTYIDLTSLLKIKHGPRWHFLPLPTIATVLGMSHDGSTDELEMVRYIHTQCLTGKEFTAAVGLLTSHLATAKPTCDSKQLFSIDGVCTAAYNARRCSCNQLSLNPHPSNQRRPKKAI